MRIGPPMRSPAASPTSTPRQRSPAVVMSLMAQKEEKGTQLVVDASALAAYPVAMPRHARYAPGGFV